MDEEFVAQSPQRVFLFQRLIQRWSTRMVPVKSPYEIHQEERRQAHAEFTVATNQVGLEASRANLDEARRCFDRLDALAGEWEADRETKEREYQQRLCDQEQAFLYDVHDIFGNASASYAVLGKWCERAGTQLPSSTGHSATIDNQAGTTTSPTTRIEDSRQTPDTHDRATRKAASDPISTSSRTHSPSERSSDPIGEQSDEDESTGPRNRSKRPTNSSAPRAPRPTKRIRSTNEEHSPSARETVDFQDVYRNGRAQVKYHIEEWRDNNYILRCTEHNLHFPKNPILNAMWHLKKAHNYERRMSFEETVSLLGVRVQNCTPKKRKMNNAVTKRYCKKKEDHLRSLSVWPDPLKGIDPQPGEMYTATWGVKPKLHALIVLPWQINDDLDMGDLAVVTLPLGRVPDCYEPNTTDGTWAEAYRPTGERGSERKYPVMCFDSEDPPGTVSWLPVGHFRPFNAQNRNLNPRFLKNFIALRRINAQQAAPTPDPAPDPENEVEQDTQDRDETGPDDHGPTGKQYAVQYTKAGAELIIIYDDDENDASTPYYEPPDTQLVRVKPEPESENDQVHTSNDTLPSNFGVPSISLEPTSERASMSMHRSPNRVATAPEAIMSEHSTASAKEHQCSPIGKPSNYRGQSSCPREVALALSSEETKKFYDDAQFLPS